MACRGDYESPAGASCQTWGTGGGKPPPYTARIVPQRGPTAHRRSRRHLQTLRRVAFSPPDPRLPPPGFAAGIIINQIEEKGFDLSKINIGLPFYSRPENADSFWGNYFDVAEDLGRWDNAYYYDEDTTLDGAQGAGNTWFNGRGMIYDKTCYAADCGAGGVMIWHIGTDSTVEGYRLMDEIASAVNSRK